LPVAVSTMFVARNGKPPELLGEEPPFRPNRRVAGGCVQPSRVLDIDGRRVIERAEFGGE
jgi:hypothetical protein